MILCLDCGNTRVKWGLWQGHGWEARGYWLTADLAARCPNLGASRPIAEIVACNVAGAVVEERIAAWGLPLRWCRAEARQAGVSNGYDNPAQLGADRWAALIGARSRHEGPCLVVNAGTATTIDVLSAEGHFEGGLILPGLDLMRSSLARGTAGLPEARGAFALRPTNTDDAIESGCLAATLGAIERMFAPLAAEQPEGGVEALCLVSGGAAPALLPHLTLPRRAVENLVLEGLARIASADGSGIM
ncbi:type III pantothenate kinase [bacterium]|nr:type III pantothenate kinase [bacterium]